MPAKFRVPCVPSQHEQPLYLLRPGESSHIIAKQADHLFLPILRMLSEQFQKIRLRHSRPYPFTSYRALSFTAHTLF
ncbi:hypothetical protein M125_0911 [Bacteroides fragilis str. 3998T(B)3]|uniref:Uncharacterized protein n=1 Tax=Bacteroides fragilis str. 3998T(B)3 TaxID=1339316 RepID=A0A015U6D7_BACFG|nr:hypothetical protein M125_0911 [Bacteroides fragilis str. 3998T(B)3]EXY97170.1 hypothetical protein M081_0634 [Bacteroides fragilis str. 3998 T(B) 4]EXY97878.1 hypothetical protein M081_5163 [Bacteroides fragilis str. 3998 T(B) 4]